MRRGKQKQKKGLNEFLFRLGRMKEDEKVRQEAPLGFTPGRFLGLHFERNNTRSDFLAPVKEWGRV
jgi:hypothetical protein